MDTLIGKRLSHYRIVEKIGEGATGGVYRGRDVRLGRAVAIKTLWREFSSDPERLSQFHLAAKVLTSLNHPGICAVYGLEEIPGDGWFLILELVEGETLSTRLRSGPLPLDESLRICEGIAEVLEATHAAGVIHCDLKPANVMLPSLGGVKVLGFGLARRSAPAGAFGQAPDPTRPGSGDTRAIVDTPGCMSPEQVRGEVQDARTDIFSLGCILYTCLTGRPAFGGGDDTREMTATPMEEPSWFALPSGVPTQVRSLLSLCLEKDRGRRLGDAGHVRAALREARSAPPSTAAAPAATPNNLPIERTSFVGREKEIAECAALLDKGRLLTLTGIGGTGKTRLALRVARGVLHRYPDGVWFIDLAPLSDPERVALTVATALGLAKEPGKPMEQTIAEHLCAKQALIVLDSCEHLVEACSAFAVNLLSTAPELRCLATSRRVLGPQGEQVYAVHSLSLPSGIGGGDLREVEASEAARLLVQRAITFDPDFGITACNALHVAGICRHLDGIPLAIELAAARLKTISVQDLHTAIRGRFSLSALGSVSRQRHHTLQAVIGWSFGHLAAAERRLLRLLSVFAGGWTLSGAVALEGGDEDSYAILDLLSRLVDNSLVILGQGVDNEPRYRMLETVREYALVELTESGEDGEARTRHLDFCVALAEQVNPRLAKGSTLGASLFRLDFDLENILSAHAWCDSVEGGAERGLRLVSALERYWVNRGQLDLGYRVTQEALARRAGQTRSRARCRALRAAGTIAYFMGRYGDAEGYLDEGLSIAREIGDRDVLAEALWLLGVVSHARGDPARARERLDESLEAARELGDKHLFAWALNSLAELHRSHGDLEQAGPLYEQCLDLARERGDYHDVSTAISLGNLAMVSIGRRAGARAHELLLESLGIGQKIGSKWVVLLALGISAGLSVLLAECERAARFHGAAREQMGRMGFCMEPTDEAFLAPLIAQARQALGDAAFSEAERAGRALSYEDALAEARAWLEGPAASNARA